MDGMSGYMGLGMWVVIIGGTAAFWAVVFLAVRALYIGRDTSGSPAPYRAGDPVAAPIEAPLARGGITQEEDLHQRAQTVPGPPSSRPPHR